MPKGHFNSLKRKSIAWIIGLVVILSSLTLITFGFMRHSLSQLSGMIDVTIVANDLRSLAGSVTEGLPAEIEAYSLHPYPEARDSILAKFSRIDGELARLEPMITQEEGRVHFTLVKNMFLSMRENFSEIEKKIATKNSFSEVNGIVASIKTGSGLISESIQQLISFELSEHQVAKEKLIKKVDLEVIFLLIGIALSSTLGMLIFYLGLIKRRILGPLGAMQDKMEKIANDTGDIKLRVRIEYNDEIGILGDFFNKMADSIQKFKEHLEELVESRTKQLRDAQSMLVQTGKLSALGEMAGGVAHEINNPLAVIQMKASQLAEMLEDETLDKPEIQRSAQAIEQTANRIARIVKGLRSFSRNATNDPFESTPLLAIVEDTLSLCSEKVKLHSVRLSAQVPSDISISCRATEISQVLLNLINNSFDSIERKEDPWIEIQAHDRGTSVEVWVTDSGHGIPDAVREKIFQPFFTTKEIGKGTGLGLSISKGIVEGHGGKFYLDNKCGNTRFVIELPKKPGERTKAA